MARDDSMTVRRGMMRDNDDMMVGTDSDRGQQLQDDMHNDKGYRICVRIHMPRDHDG